MTEIVGVRFKRLGKVYYFAPNGLQINMGQSVIVETARGIELGEITIPNCMVRDEKIVGELKNIIRIATEDDLKIQEENQKKEEEAFKICEEKIKKHKLEMRLIAAEYTLDMGKLLFYFTADGRIDFRNLVKDLASVFHTRIELRQIGVRDEAKMLGGIGACGRPICCASFLEDFQPVSINMAKEQSLSLNPTKISGTCGRLMCCLKYENDAYEHLLSLIPPVDSIVHTPYGNGTVVDISVLKGLCKVKLDSSPENPKLVSYKDCTVIKRGNPMIFEENSNKTEG